MTPNDLNTAICELIEDALADGFPASDVPNVLADVPAELEGRAEQQWHDRQCPETVAARGAYTARMMEAAR